MLDRLSDVRARRGSARGVPPRSLLDPVWRRRRSARRDLTAILALDLPDESRAMVLNRLAGAEDRLDRRRRHVRGRHGIRRARRGGRCASRCWSIRSGGWPWQPVDEATLEESRSRSRGAQLTWRPSSTTRPEPAWRCTTSATRSAWRGRSRRPERRSGGAADESRRAGHAVGEMYSWFNLGYLELQEGDYEAAGRHCVRAMDLNRDVDDRNIETRWLLGLGIHGARTRPPARCPRDTSQRCSSSSSLPRTRSMRTSPSRLTGSRCPPTRHERRMQLGSAVASPRSVTSSGLGSGALFESIEQSFAERARRLEAERGCGRWLDA